MRNAGELKVEWLELFKILLDISGQYKRVNQYQ